MSILRITARNIHEHAPHINSLIRNVFGDTPWNQYVKCPHCEMHWGSKETIDTGSHTCDVSLKPYWSENDIQKMLEEIPRHPCFSFWIATENREYQGCTWGFIESFEEVKRRLELEKDVFPTILHNSQIGYQAALAVSQHLRNKGIASSLFEKRKKDFSLNNVEHYIVRTAYGSTMYNWLIRQGYNVFYTYPKELRYQRVLMYK